MEFPPEKPSERLLKAKSALKDKGYAFSSSKKMCQLTLDGAIQEDSKFVFEVKKDDREFNQKNYEELGDIITEFVYGLLESTPMCLKRKEIPPAGPKTDQSTTRSFVYVSENFTESTKLCVIIHGSGVVRAGQWARRLIMNEDLVVGTAIPEILMAMEKGYGILVMNTNDNTRVEAGKKVAIKGCQDAIASALTTWETLVSNSKHSNIIIIGHSFGGAVCMKLAKTFQKDFDQRVVLTLLTDSAHGLGHEVPQIIRGKCINFVASEQPLNKDLGKDSSGNMLIRSAGHPVHEWTPSQSRTALFEYFKSYDAKYT